MMRRLLCLLLVSCMPSITFAMNGHGVDPVASVIFWVTLIFLFGVIGRNIALRLNLPGVLGELMMGIVLGNVCYFLGMEIATVLRESSSIFSIMGDLLKGLPLPDAVTSTITNPHYAKQVLAALGGPNGNDLLKISYVIDVFSRYGVIFLLFLVGVESSITELRHTGRASIQVALIGVIAPLCLGILVTCIFLPQLPFKSALFIGATLTATSVGITARVLAEMKVLKTREASTILGAAMIDDILGLIILAVVSGVVVTGVVSLSAIALIFLSAFLFFSCSIVFGPKLLKIAVGFFSFFEPWEEKLIVSFMFLMVLSWVATQLNLASIIGAFSAGLIIHDGFFSQGSGERRNGFSIRELLAPLETILLPLFFMLIGIQVKLEAFFDWQVLFISLVLIAAAVIGKLVSGFGAMRQDDRILIGIGMLPRGEVGLVFASIGRTIGVISDQLFSAVILMVMVTTLIAPPLLKARYAKHKVLHAS